MTQSAYRSPEEHEELVALVIEHEEREDRRAATPIFDWRRVCPFDFARKFPAVVGPGRGVPLR